jgi:hypothetical protein
MLMELEWESSVSARAGICTCDAKGHAKLQSTGNERFNHMPTKHSGRGGVLQVLRGATECPTPDEESPLRTKIVSTSVESVAWETYTIWIK